jgi:hypothetical protein
MKSVFADTSYYIALTNPRDQFSKQALHWTAGFDGAFVTTAWVLTELANTLSRGPNRRLFLDMYDDLTSDDRVNVVPPTHEMLERGFALYGERLDKEWSLTDCISFVVMHDHQLTEAATADHHFEQAGFRALLK